MYVYSQPTNMSTLYLVRFHAFLGLPLFVRSLPLLLWQTVVEDTWHLPNGPVAIRLTSLRHVTLQYWREKCVCVCVCVYVCVRERALFNNMYMIIITIIKPKIHIYTHYTSTTSSSSDKTSSIFPHLFWTHCPLPLFLPVHTFTFS